MLLYCPSTTWTNLAAVKAFKTGGIKVFYKYTSFQNCKKEKYCLQSSYSNIKINFLKTKRNLLYIRNQFVPRSKHFPPRL